MRNQLLRSGGSVEDFVGRPPHVVELVVADWSSSRLGRHDPEAAGSGTLASSPRAGSASTRGPRTEYVALGFQQSLSTSAEIVDVSLARLVVQR